MKTRKEMLAIFICFSGVSVICAAQTRVAAPSESKTIDEMKQLFYKMDDAFNLAMEKKDSLFFVDIFADSFINCTPGGVINSKNEEISTLLKLPFTHVERTALKYDIFTYSDKVATMSVTKKLVRKDASIMYVRRCMVYTFTEGKWLIASGQGTNVLPKYID